MRLNDARAESAVSAFVDEISADAEKEAAILHDTDRAEYENVICVRARELRPELARWRRSLAWVE